MSRRYIKVYTRKEYCNALDNLKKEGCVWCGGGNLIYGNGRPTEAFRHPHALVVEENGEVWRDEIRHCPDPSDRRLEATHLKPGDRVVLTDRYLEAQHHRGEVFEIVRLEMIGERPCAFLKPEGLGAYECDGLRRI